MAKRKIDPEQGYAAVLQCRDDFLSKPRTIQALAVRFLLEELAAVAPGRSVEVRVPPFAAVQCVPGPRHTRGTPPNVIEMAPAVWVRLALGDIDWQQGVQQGLISASGARANIAALLPLIKK